MLYDLWHLYQPWTGPRRLRVLAMLWGGLENVLCQPKATALGKDILSQLRLESLLEVAHQAGVVSCEGWRARGLGTLFIDHDVRQTEEAGRWLPVLFALRVRRLNVSEPIEYSKQSQRLFTEFLHLDAGVRFDPHTQAFFAEMKLRTSPEEFHSAPWGRRDAVEVYLRAAHEAKRSRTGQPELGLRNFLSFSHQLGQILRKAEGLGTLRAAIWQYYVGWFQGYMPNQAFQRALTVAKANVNRWDQEIAKDGTPLTGEPGLESRETIHEHLRALAELSTDRNQTPHRWLHFLPA